MSDIVERLRCCDCGEHCKSGCIQERAADRIEQLEAESDVSDALLADAKARIEQLEDALKICRELHEYDRAEIERLQSCLYAQENVKPLYDKIKRLQAALEDERKAHQVCVEMRNDAERRIEQLEAAMHA